MARGLNVAREAFSFGPRRHFCERKTLFLCFIPFYLDLKYVIGP